MPDNKKNNIRGLTGTFIFHATLLAVIFYFGFITPLPLPDEQGILINFGENDIGAGEEEPAEQITQQVPPTVSESIQEEVEPEQMTQDFQEAPVVEKKEKEVKKEPEENIKQKEPAPEEVKKEEVTERREADPRSLFPGKSPDSPSTSEGTGYEAGNMGDPAGQAETGSYDGTGQGQEGISFSLTGRIAQSLPVPEYNYQRGGIVVVEITVNKDGRVTEAIPGVRGSTTLDEYLLRVAKNAAFSARFDRKPDAPAFQRGTITYHFKLQ